MVLASRKPTTTACVFGRSAMRWAERIMVQGEEEDALFIVRSPASVISASSIRSCAGCSADPAG